MTTSPEPPVLLVAHGTRDESGRAELRQLHSIVAARHPAPVHIGVIEYACPGLPFVFPALAAAVAAARERGSDEVRIVPLLLFPAGHAGEDVRVIVRGGRLLHPGVRLRCTPLLRPAPPLLAALRDRIAAAEATRLSAAADALLVVGRGSTWPHANRRLDDRIRAWLADVDGRPVGHAFASLALPTVSDGLDALVRRGALRIVVAPYLLNDGRIARRIAAEARAWAERTSGVEVAVADHLGLHDAVVAYVLARVSGERGTAIPAPASPAPASPGAADEEQEPAPHGRAVAHPAAVGPGAGEAAHTSGTRPTARLHTAAVEQPRAALDVVPRRRFPRPLVIAGTASGAGKTMLTAGLLAALRARGLVVQPFKVGPDYIDPLHHTAVAGRSSRNLDTVLCPPATVAALAARAMRDADVALVEGVLGLFDGRLATARDDPRAGDRGSTAEVARTLRAAVVLVVDCASAARSVAAVALGFARFDPRVVPAAIVLNRVGSERHAEAARAAVEAATGIPVVGAIPRRDDLVLPERYLGLVPPQERPHPPSWADRLGALVAAHVDLDALLALAAAGEPPRVDPRADPFSLPPSPPRARVAVARDAAFSFAYVDALDLLAHRGAEVVPFSPLGDSHLPDCGAILVGGGFPERFAAMLEENVAMRRSVAAAAAAGVPIVGECGGAMYLGRTLVTEDGEAHAMCGVTGWTTRMGRERRALGYREVTALTDTPLLRAGEQAVGHEFHWSWAESDDREAPAYAVSGGGTEGTATATVLASYVHLHLCGIPKAASRLVRAAAAAEARIAAARR